MKSFKFDKNQVIGSIAPGVVLLVMAVLFATPIGFSGIIFIIVGIWKRDREALKLHEDYFEYQVAPAQSVQRVVYRDIQSFEVGEKKIVIKYPQKDKEKKVTIALNFFAKEERAQIKEELCRVYEAAKTKEEGAC